MNRSDTYFLDAFAYLIGCNNIVQMLLSYKQNICWKLWRPQVFLYEQDFPSWNLEYTFFI